MPMDIWESQTVDPEGFLIDASRNYNAVTNAFLQGAGNVRTNVAPYIMPYDCSIMAIAAACRTIATWTAQVYVNGSLLPGGELALNNEKRAYINGLDLQLNEGDEVSLRCSGSNINRPRIVIYVKRRWM